MTRNETLRQLQRPRFTPGEKNELTRRFHLSLGSEIKALEGQLMAISDMLRPPPVASDVHSQLSKLCSHLESALCVLNKWRKAASRPYFDGSWRSPMKEALSKLNMVASGLIRNRDQHGVDIHDDLDPASLIDFAAALASMAQADLPKKRSYAGRESPDAIARIVCALRVGRTDGAPLGQKITKVSRSGKFFDLAKIIWAAVLGKDSKVSPARSIQAYIRLEREREQACMNGAAERRGAVLADVALIDGPTCAAASGIYLSAWHELVRLKVAPQPVIRQTRCTRWKISHLRSRLIERAAPEPGAEADVVTARADRASSRARTPEATAKAMATRAVTISARKRATEQAKG